MSFGSSQHATPAKHVEQQQVKTAKKMEIKFPNRPVETCDKASANNTEALERKRIQPPLHLLLFLLII